MEYSTGYELLLNACEGALQIVLTDNEKPLCFQEYFNTRRATEILAPALQEIFQKTGITAGKLRRIGCFAGPGSFTGIRLVLATAAAIRRCTESKLASLDYLQALATSAIIRRNWMYPGRVCVITHARLELVHYQEFTSFGPQIPAAARGAAELIAPISALTRLGSEHCLVCGSGIKKHAGLFSTPVTGQGPMEAPNAVIMPELVNPDLAALCLLGRHGDYFDLDVEPKYVRGCDAAENLELQAGVDAPELVAMRELLAKPAKSDE